MQSYRQHHKHGREFSYHRSSDVVTCLVKERAPSQTAGIYK